MLAGAARSFQHYQGGQVKDRKSPDQAFRLGNDFNQ
jgi:hypothetical protein